MKRCKRLTIEFDNGDKPEIVKFEVECAKLEKTRREVILTLIKKFNRGEIEIK